MPEGRRGSGFKPHNCVEASFSRHIHFTVIKDDAIKSYNTNLLPRARSMRRTMTAAERHLWFVCLRNGPYRFRRQRPFGNFIVDFYCAELKLVIEVDGDSHFDPASKAYDQQRTLFLGSLGLRVLRFGNDDVMYRIEAVSDVLADYFKKPHLA